MIKVKLDFEFPTYQDLFETLTKWGVEMSIPFQGNVVEYPEHVILNQKEEGHPRIKRKYTKRKKDKVKLQTPFRELPPLTPPRYRTAPFNTMPLKNGGRQRGQYKEGYNQYQFPAHWINKIDEKLQAFQSFIPKEIHEGQANYYTQEKLVKYLKSHPDIISRREQIQLGSGRYIVFYPVRSINGKQIIAPDYPRASRNHVKGAPSRVAFDRPPQLSEEEENERNIYKQAGKVGR
jgi:hypothetical protein